MSGHISDVMISKSRIIPLTVLSKLPICGLYLLRLGLEWLGFTLTPAPTLTLTLTLTLALTLTRVVPDVPRRLARCARGGGGADGDGAPAEATAKELHAQDGEDEHEEE